jgi:hypothetical protein
MKKSIPRPFKSPWTYKARWLSGDENMGRRWGVVNVTHEIIVYRFPTEAEAKAAAREHQKQKRKAATLKVRAVVRAVKSKKKIDEFITKKQGAKFFKSIPFPA